MRRWGQCAGIALFFCLVQGACADTPRQSATTIGQALDQPPRFAFELLVPSAIPPTAGILVATSGVRLGDRSQVIQETGNTYVANLGTADTLLGQDSVTDSVASVGSVRVGNRAEVRAGVWTTGQVFPEPDSSIAASYDRLPAIGAGKWSCEFVFPESNADAVGLEPDQVRSLVAGRFGTIAVKSRAELRLDLGTYYLDSLALEPQARVILRGPTHLIVAGQVALKGEFLGPNGAEPELTLTVLGEGAPCYLEQPLAADVVAPQRRLVLAKSGATFRGFLLAREIEIYPDVLVRPRQPGDFALASCTPPNPEADPLPPGRPSASPPALVQSGVPVSESVAAFLDWLATATRSEVPALAAAVKAVYANSEVAEALVMEFEGSRRTNDLRALLALATLGELSSVEGEDFFVRLLGEPANGDAEIMYRLKAVHGLGYRFSGRADLELLRLASEHELRIIRAEALRTYVFNQSDEVREAARSVVRPGEEALADRFENRTLDGVAFDDRLAEYLARHPQP